MWVFCVRPRCPIFILARDVVASHRLAEVRKLLAAGVKSNLGGVGVATIQNARPLVGDTATPKDQSVAVPIVDMSALDSDVSGDLHTCVWALYQRLLQVHNRWRTVQ